MNRILLAIAIALAPSVADAQCCGVARRAVQWALGAPAVTYSSPSSPGVRYTRRGLFGRRVVAVASPSARYSTAPRGYSYASTGGVSSAPSYGSTGGYNAPPTATVPATSRPSCPGGVCPPSSATAESGVCPCGPECDCVDCDCESTVYAIVPATKPVVYAIVPPTQTRYAIVPGSPALVAMR